MVENRIKSGDLVRRDAEDVWRIVSIPNEYVSRADLAECACERPPLGWLRPDGTRGKPWAKPGRIEYFIISDLEPLDQGTLDRSPTMIELRNT